MERTITAEEAKSYADSDLVQEPKPDLTPEMPKLKPLPTFACSIPEGWKDAIYGKDGTGSASADNDWPK